MKNSNLIFGLMAAFGKEEYSFSDLTHLLAPFKVTESSLRTNLSRMTGKGILKSRREGKWSYYSFTEKGVAIRSNVALSFRSLDWSGWDESWWGVIFSIPEIEKSERYKIRKNLLAHRFVSQYPGFWIRPLSKIEKMDRRLRDIFMNKRCKIIRFHYFDEISVREISHLWKLNEINDGFKIGLETLRTKEGEIGAFNPEQALIEKIVVGDEIVSFLFKEPLLPDQFLPDNWKCEELRNRFLRWDKEITRISQPYWGKIFV